MESCESNEYAIVHKQKPPANRSAAHSVVCVPRRQNIAPLRQTPCYPCKIPTLRITSPLHLLYTFALPTPYLGRFMFGFRLK
ncbi:MAG: hypothetical protein ACFNUE_02655, partial [Bacteroides sp.]